MRGCLLISLGADRGILMTEGARIVKHDVAKVLSTESHANDLLTQILKVVILSIWHDVVQLLRLKCGTVRLPIILRLVLGEIIRRWVLINHSEGLARWWWLFILPYYGRCSWEWLQEIMRLRVSLQSFLRIHRILDEDLMWQLLGHIFGIKVWISMPTVRLLTRICVIDLLVITSAEIIIACTWHVYLGHPPLRLLREGSIILVMTSSSG